jgi:glycosyltransferase involved in cell wall biosynthesis/predicted O-methyltransferase YrrM
MEREPVVSFIMPARDVEAFIAESVDSALAQTEPSLEVIVIDDGSTDRTAEIAREKSRADPRVRVQSQAGAGVRAARDAGIRLARGRYLCFLDADDVVPPDKIRVQAGILDARPEIDVVYADCHRLVPGTDGGWVAGSPMVSETDALATILRVECPFQIHCALFRRGVVEKAGGFRVGPDRAEDLHLHARLALSGARFLHVPEPSGYYRIRPDSLSRDPIGMTRGRIAVAALLLRLLPRSQREERRFPRLRARYLSIVAGTLLADRGRYAASRRAALSSLRWGCGPGHLWEVLRLVLRPRGLVVADYRAQIRADHGFADDGDDAPRPGRGRALRREVAALAARWPPLRDVAAARAASRRALRSHYRRYIRDVSGSRYALSLETGAVLDALCRIAAPRRILDLGSGFSSFVFRRTAARGDELRVRSYDDQPWWLDRTRKFLLGSGCPADGLLPVADLAREEAGSFDLVCHDIGDMETRARLLPRALDLARPGTGVVLLDDVHMADYRRVVEVELSRRGAEPLRTRELTLDDLGRHAWLVTGL